jgi:CRP-like cAMP-binding protein
MIGQADSLWTAAHADFLSGLSNEERAALLRRARTLKFPKREHVFEVGDASGTVFIVLSGTIRLYQLAANGRQTILWLCLKGELFGLAEMTGRGSREIYAEAVADCEVLQIVLADFASFLAAHPQAAMRAMGILSARVRAIGSSLAEIVAHPVEARLARLLLRYSALTPAPCQSAAGVNERCINIGLTHLDISASMEQFGWSAATCTL